MFANVFIFEFPSKRLCPQTRIAGFITHLFPNSKYSHFLKSMLTLISLTSSLLLNTRTTILLVVNLLISENEYLSEVEQRCEHFFIKMCR